MTLWPAVQVRAQAELDRALGTTFAHPPALADRPRLPYVAALALELLRWNPAVPLGLAHCLARDDVYRGHRIAKGTVVWANIWCVDGLAGCLGAWG